MNITTLNELCQAENFSSVVPCDQVRKPGSRPGSGQGDDPSFLDTLGQLRIAPSDGAFEGASPSRGVLDGQSAAETLRKRARSKFLSHVVARRLADLNSPLKDAYWDAYYCAQKVHQRRGKLVSEYCDRRWCLVCARIRTAKAIRVYVPVFESWGPKQFLTLTVRNPAADGLPGKIDEMYEAWRRMMDNLRKTYGIHYRGVRKLEVTYNLEEGTYHPHFHVIFEGCGGDAEQLIRLWMQQFPAETERSAQQYRQADRGSELELFKYFAKPIGKRKGAQRRDVFVPGAMDVIFQAVQGRRTFQSFGCTLPKEEGVETVEDADGVLAAWKRVDEEILWLWRQLAHDYVDPETGDVLTEYRPSEKFLRLVKQIEEGG